MNDTTVNNSDNQRFALAYLQINPEFAEQGLELFKSLVEYHENNTAVVIPIPLTDKTANVLLDEMLNPPLANSETPTLSDELVTHTLLNYILPMLSVSINMAAGKDLVEPQTQNNLLYKFPLYEKDFLQSTLENDLYQSSHD